MQWYSGINYDCQLVENTNYFVVRVWEGPSCGGDRADSATCFPGDGSYYNSSADASVRCHDDIYVYGELNSTKDCQSEIGRGSALVVSGCCQFFGVRPDGCAGATPYTSLEEGACNEQIQIASFTCVSTLA